nr:uncharacterized protein LOC108010524 [Drosophila suzukii]
MEKVPVEFLTFSPNVEQASHFNFLCGTTNYQKMDKFLWSGKSEPSTSEEAPGNQAEERSPPTREQIERKLKAILEILEILEETSSPGEDPVKIPPIPPTGDQIECKLKAILDILEETSSPGEDPVKIPPIPEPPVLNDRRRKRPMEDDFLGDSTEGLPKKPKKSMKKEPELFPNSLDSKDPGITMAVMAKSYPSLVMSMLQLARIEYALVKEMRRGWIASMNFEGIRYFPGYILVKCMDENSKKWLEHVMPKITEVIGIELITCPKDEIPATMEMYVCVPHSAHENDNKIMKHLIDQNQDLLSKSWQFGRSLKFPNGDKVVSIKISKKSLLLLQERGWMVSYCFNQLLACIMPKSVSLKPKGNNTYEEEEQERN